MRNVNPNISDLFFNTDFEDATVMMNGRFDHYDNDKMLDTAKTFLACLERLGLTDLPSPEDLVNDFYARV